MKLESKGSISVIMPARNAEQFIAEALSSINVKTGPAPQVIVIDDASTDATASVVERIGASNPQIALLSLASSIGPGPARNLGLARAQGEFIAFLDADDRYSPGGLDLMREQLLREPEADLVMGRIQVLRKRAQTAQQFAPDGAHVRCFQLGSILVRAPLFGRIGSFDESFRHGEDMDWFFRAQEAQAVFRLIEEVVLYHLRHEGNMSHDTAGAAEDLAMIMFGSLKRRKALAARRGTSIEDLYYVRPDVSRLDELDEEGAH